MNASVPNTVTATLKAPAAVHIRSRQLMLPMVMAGSTNSRMPVGLIVAATIAQAPAANSAARRRSGCSAA